MRRKILKLAMVLLSLASTGVAFGQGPEIYLYSTTEETPSIGHHIDAFFVESRTPIRTLDATINFGPLVQIHPGGHNTVFPDLLAPADLRKDSHFVFDKSSATITVEYEDNGVFGMSAIFNANYPASFKLAQAVVGNHSAYFGEIAGTFVDGRAFHTSVMWVPEPSAITLCLVGGALWLGWYHHRRRRIGG